MALRFPAKFAHMVLGASALLLSGSGARSQPAASSAPTAASAAPELDAAVRAMVHDRALKDAQVGVLVMDADTGAVLAHAGEHVVLNPASNAKLYTAAAALALLGGAHRYDTT